MPLMLDFPVAYRHIPGRNFSLGTLNAHMSSLVSHQSCKHHIFVVLLLHRKLLIFLLRNHCRWFCGEDSDQVTLLLGVVWYLSERLSLHHCDLSDCECVCLMCQAVRKLHGHLKAVKEAAVERNLPQAKPITLTPQEQSLDEDLDEAAQVSLLVYNGSYLLVPCL